jgi:hypothetical protein
MSLGVLNGASPVTRVLPLRVTDSRQATSGEQRLLLALLCDAMHAFAAERARRKPRARLAELTSWFESTDRSYVFAFESVCDALGLDPTFVRERVIGPRATSLRRPWAHRVHCHRIVPPRVRTKRAATA